MFVNPLSLKSPSECPRSSVLHETQRVKHIVHPYWVSIVHPLVPLHQSLNTPWSTLLYSSSLSLCLPYQGLLQGVCVGPDLDEPAPLLALSHSALSLSGRYSTSLLLSFGLSFALGPIWQSPRGISTYRFCPGRGEQGPLPPLCSLSFAALSLGLEKKHPHSLSEFALSAYFVAHGKHLRCPR